MAAKSTNKLFFEAYKDVEIAPKPLERVICQIRFPAILKLSKDDELVSNFQEEIRQEFPHIAVEEGIVVNLGEVIEKNIQRVWRFTSADKKKRISLAADFIAFETLHYSTRTSFHEDLKKYLDLAKKVLKPGVCTRVGTRYINRISDFSRFDIGDLIRPEVAGISTVLENKLLKHSITESSLPVDSERYCTSRWGFLSSNDTYDATAVVPIGAESWVFDVDIFSRNAFDAFDVDEIVNFSSESAERIFSLFRWAFSGKKFDEAFPEVQRGS